MIFVLIFSTMLLATRHGMMIDIGSSNLTKGIRLMHFALFCTFQSKSMPIETRATKAKKKLGEKMCSND